MRLLVPTDPLSAHSSSDALRFAGTSATDIAAVSPSGDSLLSFRPSTSPRRRPSPSDFSHPCPPDCSKRSTLERSRSISAVLFTKVKDRIVEKIFQTATEGPHLAAIVQERRQRAADEYEARRQTGTIKALRKDHLQQQQHGGGLQADERCAWSCSNSRRIRNSRTSSPIKAMTINEEVGECEAQERIRMARAAFRRRSVSQDGAQMEMFLRPNGVHERIRTRCETLRSSGCDSQNFSSSTGSQAFDGIICSNDDFQAILMMGQQNNSKTTGGQPCQKRLSSRALSFNHGSFQGMRSLGEATQKQRCGSNSSMRNEIEAPTDLDCRSPVEGSSDLISRVGFPSGPDSISRPYQEFEVEEEGPSLIAISRAASVVLVNDHDETLAVQDGQTLATVPEIEYDENGQTWDVYGAEFDPEILGDAIQLHLRRLIERKLSDLHGQKKTPNGDKEIQLKDSADASNLLNAKIDEISKVDRRRFFRATRKSADSTTSGSSRFFSYLCAFSKRRYSSNEAT